MATPAAARPCRATHGPHRHRGVSLGPPADRAGSGGAVLRANHAPPPPSLLRAEIKDAMGRNNKQAWLMLFDLYQIAGEQAPSSTRWRCSSR
jgi:hypothetical protein